MKITILRSSFQTDNFVLNEYAELIQRLENECRAEINIIGDESDYLANPRIGSSPVAWTVIFSVNAMASRPLTLT